MGPGACGREPLTVAAAQRHPGELLAARSRNGGRVYMGPGSLTVYWLYLLLWVAWRYLTTREAGKGGTALSPRNRTQAF